MKKINLEKVKVTKERSTSTRDAWKYTIVLYIESPAKKEITGLYIFDATN